MYEPKNDKHGVGTLVILLVVVIVVVAAAATYIVIASGDDDSDKLREMGPGTVMEYDVSINGSKMGSAKYDYIGQNSGEYFVEMTVVLGGGSATYYDVGPKGVPTGAKKTGTVELDTMDGRKTLDVWEYTKKEGGAVYNMKAYADQERDMTYRQEAIVDGILEVQELTSYSIKWQESYKESESIGDTYVYSAKLAGIPVEIYIKCIADCDNGRYGILFDFESYTGESQYVLSDYSRGLPSDAADTGERTTLKGTIDGDVSVEKWTLDDGEGIVWTFFCGSESHVIYRISTDATGMETVFDLSKKP
ncbi:MAG: hypothetical protein LBU30_01385 [Candidatus Methanoplasma sp.]|jgi:hypothetical protein|nr:hypothetical protein [Candidatus Methanoplasma sp.]